MYNEADPETPQWEAFLETWYDVIGNIAVTATELISHISDSAELRACLPDAIADTEARNYSVRLGQRLSKRNGVRYPNGFALAKAGEKKRAVTWQAVRFKNTTSPQFSLKGEVGEVDITPAHGKIENNNKYIYKDRPQQTSPNLTLATKMGEVALEKPPHYPIHPCNNCSYGDYRLTDRNEWLCSRCHPKPGGGTG
jgi:hypothetical protein